MACSRARALACSSAFARRAAEWILASWWALRSEKRDVRMEGVDCVSEVGVVGAVG